MLDSIRVGFNAVPLLGPLTGVGQYTFRLITEMQQLLRVRPWLFYGTSWDTEIRSAAPAAIRQMNNAMKRLVPQPHVVARFIKQSRFSSGVKANRIDLYHEPAYLAFRFKGPTVVTVHDISWIRHPETHPQDRVREMNRVMPSVVKRAEHIIVDSEFVRSEVIDHYGVAPERVTTVLLGASPEFHPVAADQCASVLKQFGLSPGRYVLAVGTLEPRKNLSTVIAAYAQLPDAVRQRYPLVIVGMNGWGMEKFSDSLKHMIRRGEVRLPGYVAQADLPALYSGARLFVYPSLYEGFGLPPLEAMACKVPVIASNRASLPEVVGDAGLLVEPLDDVAIAAHMRALIEDDALHARLSMAGLVRADGFTWRKFALETLAVYRKVLA
ncbi:glycosyltransferase family 4 protein [Noviherbaspirillum saxi]|uniref:Glycosyltransferase family 1 protein n=1 Tax=Noviherbaspirillum saxi TaxID=2320863 RepID=A0A3A3FTI4_9BURK|nr:glycosyltransferase family 1 protein [Noviherbaspirillum saxi]RJF97808.1 glycosyltransferase family 1 protein [Noviherbaspirillum saxi]